jgi:hypothetical protein
MLVVESEAKRCLSESEGLDVTVVLRVLRNCCVKGFDARVCGRQL